ncbi:MAG: hypothetical protein P4M15_07730 [Alphaproteobacteria bacterium]|nr:hypothetical protein [Alphaproteobacteria bacterium]
MTPTPPGWPTAKGRDETIGGERGYGGFEPKADDHGGQESADFVEKVAE